jgi:predicted regulator of Ras-like GTPase activity (Roadblock/LC7/MglB family)
MGENLDDILKKLVLANPGVKAALIVSREGLPIASFIPEGVDETRIAAMASSLFSLARQSNMELGERGVVEVSIKGSFGHLLVHPIGDTAIIFLSTEDGFDGFGRDLISGLGPFKPPGASPAASTIEEDLER